MFGRVQIIAVQRNSVHITAICDETVALQGVWILHLFLSDPRMTDMRLADVVDVILANATPVCVLSHTKSVVCLFVWGLGNRFSRNFALYVPDVSSPLWGRYPRGPQFSA